jgi:hypothetical protein
MWRGVLEGFLGGFQPLGGRINIRRDPFSSHKPKSYETSFWVLSDIFFRTPMKVFFGVPAFGMPSDGILCEIRWSSVQ